jgi:arabinofuranosyltransferase
MLSVLRTRKFILIIPLVLIFIFMLIRISWLGDDAFISMRTVDNFVHGYGLRWNVDERVQVFTHPLWVFLLAAVYSILRDPYMTLLGLTITVSIITFFLLLILVPHSTFSMILAGMILLFSKAFIDYSTSGLENPATHLLLLGFCIAALSTHPIGEKRIFLLSLLAGLLMLNRMDAVLFVLPLLAVVLWQNRSRRTLTLFIAGMSPFLLWEAFSLIYYGSLVPNSYYAKLNTGVPAGALIAQGLKYFLNSLSLNPITLVIIFAALGLAFNGKEVSTGRLSIPGLHRLHRRGFYEWTLLHRPAGHLCHLAHPSRGEQYHTSKMDLGYVCFRARLGAGSGQIL